jgi:hypothetical protein
VRGTFGNLDESVCRPNFLIYLGPVCCLTRYGGYGANGYGSAYGGYGSRYGSGYGMGGMGMGRYGYGTYGGGLAGAYGGGLYGGQRGMAAYGPEGGVGWLQNVYHVVSSLGHVTELLGMNTEALGHLVGTFMGFVETIRQVAAQISANPTRPDPTARHPAQGQVGVTLPLPPPCYAAPVPTSVVASYYLSAGISTEAAVGVDSGCRHPIHGVKARPAGGDVGITTRVSSARSVIRVRLQRGAVADPQPEVQRDGLVTGVPPVARRMR